MKKSWMSFYTCILALVFTTTVDAKRFTNQYTEFELPGGWECQLEGTEWVCQSLNKDRKKEAIIILAAKLRGQKDDLAEYQNYLKAPKTFTLPGGKTQVSEAKYTKKKEVNQHQWIDSLHMASEVPGFYTRYLATVKEDLGVAVTLSVSKDHYAAYQSIFDSIVSSLRVFRDKKVSVGKFNQVKGDDDLIGEGDFEGTNGPLADIGIDRDGKGGSGDGGGSDMLWLILIATGGAGVVLKLKKGKKGKKKKKKKK
ncbi:MAG: hypothetical protein CME70_14575 [Halobacteriovorax sp.]|nr:hypothetical protein [Halobacteriovorax sp.]|tara:strand:+ start:220335 stop:221096 length:762 start_codon:yes stop_codon:yes gene_type:complete